MVQSIPPLYRSLILVLPKATGSPKRELPPLRCYPQFFADVDIIIRDRAEVGAQTVTDRSWIQPGIVYPGCVQMMTTWSRPLGARPAVGLLFSFLRRIPRWRLGPTGRIVGYFRLMRSLREGLAGCKLRFRGEGVLRYKCLDIYYSNYFKDDTYSGSLKCNIYYNALLTESYPSKAQRD